MTDERGLGVLQAECTRFGDLLMMRGEWKVVIP